MCVCVGGGGGGGGASHTAASFYSAKLCIPFTDRIVRRDERHVRSGGSNIVQV